MPNLLRYVLAIVAGLVVGGLVNMALITLSPSLIPPPAGVDVNDAESLRQSIHLFELKQHRRTRRYVDCSRFYRSYMDTAPDEVQCYAFFIRVPPLDVFPVEELPGPFSMVYLEAEGGAIARQPRSATAFPHRDAPYALHIFPGWSDPAEDERMIEWARAFHETMKPHSTGGVYVNLLGGDEADGSRSAYGSNYDRLAELKRRYDPENLFRVNNKVDPST